ncbi:MAG: GAF domain-containing protein [Deltaproteobacteria bacterium]|nr:GAF domain-containing protein [Deltaproteobacteria bacterium]
MKEKKDIYDLFSIWSPLKRVSYPINGVLMGFGAPLGWLIISAFFFRPPHLALIPYFVSELSGSVHQIALFVYMTLGTSMVMGVTGYLVGAAFDRDEAKAEQLKRAHDRIEEQKEKFESRFHHLSAAMTNLYQIGADIQQSRDRDQVLELISEGAHSVLEFDRINLFLLDDERKNLLCRATRGQKGEGWRTLKIPLDKVGGALAGTIVKNETIRVEDITVMSKDWRLQPPYDRIPELRSRSFVCIPLRERGKPIGLIAVDNKVGRRPIRDEKLSPLQILADQGSTALTNISLFDGINRLDQELERNFEGLLNQKEAFAKIVGDLSARAEEIRNNMLQVAANAEGLSGAVTETASSVHEMSSALNEVAGGVSGLREAAEKTVASTTELGMSIREVESHAKESNVLSEQAKGEAEEGVSLVRKSISGIGEIRDIVLESVHIMERFGRKTEKISEVLEVINSINEKTNVLALNAAIISNQAGEHGKGFGVVSSEIRALSDKTKASSREIEEMILDLQEEVRETTAKIQSIPQQVETGVKLSRKSGAALNKILESAVTSLGMTRQIEHATREQVKSTENVSQALDRVNEMIQMMTRSIEEQNRGSKVVAEANESIRQITEEVAQATVSQSEEFKRVSDMVQQVSEMVSTLFENAEKRKAESEYIIEGIQLLDRKRATA